MKKFALAVVLLLTLQGCAELDDLFASSQNGNPVDEVEKAKYESFPFEQMAPDAPPAPRYETHGAAPGNPDEYTWRNGHWVYLDGHGFNWVRGYWLRKPAFSADWRQDMWLQHTYGWAFVPGHWQ